MYIVKILKRKDAASIIVAVYLGLALISFINPYAFEVVNWVWPPTVSEVTVMWEETYFRPLVTLVAEIVVLELFLRLAVLIRGAMVRKSK